MINVVAKLNKDSDLCVLINREINKSEKLSHLVQLLQGVVNEPNHIKKKKHMCKSSHQLKTTIAQSMSQDCLRLNGSLKIVCLGGCTKSKHVSLTVLFAVFYCFTATKLFFFLMIHFRKRQSHKPLGDSKCILSAHKLTSGVETGTLYRVRTHSTNVSVWEQSCRCS